MLVPVHLNATVQRDDVADLDAVDDALAKDVDALRGDRVIVGLERANPDTVVVGSRDEAAEVANGLAGQRRHKLVAIDFSNGDGSGRSGSGERCANEANQSRGLHDAVRD